MTTNENKTANPIGSDGNQSNLQNSDQTDLSENNLLDELDIDLNLDGVDLPTPKTEEDRISENGPENSREYEEEDRISENGPENDREYEEDGGMAENYSENDREYEEEDRISENGPENSREYEEDGGMAENGPENDREYEEEDRISENGPENSREYEEEDIEDEEFEDEQSLDEISDELQLEPLEELDALADNKLDNSKIDLEKEDVTSTSLIEDITEATNLNIQENEDILESKNLLEESDLGKDDVLEDLNLGDLHPENKENDLDLGANETGQEEKFMDNLDLKEGGENELNTDWISVENQKVADMLVKNEIESEQTSLLENVKENSLEDVENDQKTNLNDLEGLFGTEDNQPIVDTKIDTEQVELDNSNIGISGVESYVPNEDAYGQTKEILSSSEPGKIDLSATHTQGNVDDISISNLEIENNTNKVQLNIDDVIKSSEFEPIQVNLDDTQNTNQNLISLDGLMGNQEIQSSGNPQKQNFVDEQNNTTVSHVEYVKKKSKFTGLKVFVFFVLLLSLGFLILKTMYPEEMKDIMGTIKNGNSVDIQNVEEDEFVDDLNNIEDGEYLDDIDNVIDLEEDDFYIDLNPDSLVGQLDASDTGNNEDNIDNIDVDEYLVDDLLDNEHGAADFNPFDEIDNMLDNSNEELLKRLKEYWSDGEDFHNWGMQNNNTTAIKYGLFIMNYAENFIEDVESGLEIDILNIDEYMERFDTYILKLNELRNSIQSSLINTDQSIDESENNTEW